VTGPQVQASAPRATGAFDKGLFAEYAAATGAEKRRLEGRLLLDNEPLVKKLVAQFRGEDKEPPRRGFSKAKRLPGIEHVEWEECLAAGMTALLKALRKLDLAKGGLTMLTRWKIQHELQTIIDKAQVVNASYKRRLDDRPKGFDFLQGEEFDRAVEPAPEAREEEGPDPEIARARPRSALALFIETRCRFRRTLVTTRDALFGAYETHARLLQFPAATHMLASALKERGVTAQRGTMAGGVTGAFFRGVGVIALSERSRSILLSE
jgi:hypothetical protein